MAMPPSLRRRGQGHPSPHFADPISDSDEPDIAEEQNVVDEAMADDVGALVAEVEDEDDDEPLGSPLQSDSINHAPPIPPNFREISTLASWTVSSSKPGCSIPQLRNPSTSLFWQSDGPQPHWLNIHFFKLVRIVGLRLFLDFEADESYTPTRIVFLAGSGGNDLVEWGEMRLEQPRGWVWADFSGVGDVSDDEDEDEDEDDEDIGEDEDEEALQGLADALEHDGSDSENAQPAPSSDFVGGDSGPDPMVIDQQTPIQHVQLQTPTNAALLRGHPRRALQSLNANISPSLPPRREKKVKMPVLRAHLVQIRILENHQNGKDTHLRGLQIFAKDNEGAREARAPRKSIGLIEDAGASARRKSRKNVTGVRGLTRSEWDVEPTLR